MSEYRENYRPSSITNLYFLQVGMKRLLMAFWKDIAQKMLCVCKNCRSTYETILCQQLKHTCSCTLLYRFNIPCFSTTKTTSRPQGEISYYQSKLTRSKSGAQKNTTYDDFLEIKEKYYYIKNKQYIDKNNRRAPSINFDSNEKK